MATVQERKPSGDPSCYSIWSVSLLLFVAQETAAVTKHVEKSVSGQEVNRMYTDIPNHVLMGRAALLRAIATADPEQEG